MNPFEVLGLSQEASEDEIKKAYRSLAKKYHPDNQETGDESKFKQIQEAYEFAMDIKKNGQSAYYKRQNYANGSSQQSGYTQTQYADDFFRMYGFNFDDLFSGMNGFYQSGGSKDQQAYNSAAAYINNRQYQEALNILDNIADRSSVWFYYGALAHAGLGNTVTARQYAKAAYEMDPNNYNYRNLYASLNQGRNNYRQYTANNYNRRYYSFGSPNVCGRFLLYNLLFNIFCGWRFGFCCF